MERAVENARPVAMNVGQDVGGVSRQTQPIVVPDALR